MLAACEQADPTEPVSSARNGFELAAYYGAPAGTIDCSNNANRTKIVPVTVRDQQSGLPLSDAVAVVTVIDPAANGAPRCWGTTASGVLNVKLPTDASRIFAVRTEVNAAAPMLEIVPPAVPSNPSIFRHEPVGTRYGGMIVGGRRCTTTSEFGWPELVAITRDPCRINQVNSIAVSMPRTTKIIRPVFLDLDGKVLPNVIVSAFNGAAFQPTFNKNDVNKYCQDLPYLNTLECNDADSHGPGFVYAMSVTQAPTDEDAPETALPEGLAVPEGKPILIEAIATLNAGASLFGTIENYDEDTTPPGALVMEAGICRVDSLADIIDSSGASALNIDSVKFGVGLVFSPTTAGTGGELVGASLDPVTNSLVTKVLIDAYAASTGSITYNLRMGGGNRTVRATFAIDPVAQTCGPYPSQAGAWTGNGLDPAQGFVFCNRVGPSRYSVVFQLYGMEGLTSATYSLKTDPAGSMSGDNLDPSRAGLTGAAVPFDLNPGTCPIQLNTDGRLIGIG